MSLCILCVSVVRAGPAVRYEVSLAQRESHTLAVRMHVTSLTNNRRGFEDLVRLMNWWFAKRGVGFEDSDLERAASAVAQADLGDFFRRYVAGTEELPLAEYLALAGWELRGGKIVEMANPIDRQLRIRRGLFLQANTAEKEEKGRDFGNEKWK